ncbi:DUF6410 domain-containing protein [Streptomyces sp. NPDC050738]|uniref:DUF6410 domain-containing protein n=1 Tax=Streptomyces sp. NPDC050738 TaxID=3154744 RepID=UPI003412FFC4
MSTAAHSRVLGKEAGPLGRAVRILAGASALTQIISTKIPERTGGEVTTALITVVVLAAAYTLLVAALKSRLRSRRSSRLAGWPGGALLLLPMLLYPIGVLPHGAALGVALFVESSALIAGLIGYGGLEFAAIPSLVLGYRPLLYGPYNAVDLAERGFRGEEGTARRTAGLLAAAALAWYWTVPALAAVRGPVGRVMDHPDTLGPAVGGFLLLAGVLFALPAGGPLTQRRLRLAALFALLGLGGAAGAVPDVLWPAVILPGLVIGALRLQSGDRRHRPRAVRPVAVETSSTAR